MAIIIVQSRSRASVFRFGGDGRPPDTGKSHVILAFEDAGGCRSKASGRDLETPIPIDRPNRDAAILFAPVQYPCARRL